jgi:hypothetical protein
MSKDIHFDEKDCLAANALDKLACALTGPNWEKIRDTPTSSLDDVTERCKRCGFERIRPHW